MKKVILATILSIFGLIAFASGNGEADIQFEKTSHNFGTFNESEKMTCTFKFTNTGDKLLVIHQAVLHADAPFLNIPSNPSSRAKVVRLW